MTEGERERGYFWCKGARTERKERGWDGVGWDDERNEMKEKKRTSLGQKA